MGFHKDSTEESQTRLVQFLLLEDRTLNSHEGDIASSRSTKLSNSDQTVTNSDQRAIPTIIQIV